jgi:predicted GH43/DUF377 family glycosyl hydrolase
MLLIERAGIVLERTELAFEAKGVLNPAVITFNGQIHMFYRAVSNNMVSTLGHCELSDPLTIHSRSKAPIVSPLGQQESMGIEDPRIVKIEQYFFLSYTAFDGKNALGALLLSKDLKAFSRAGIIVPEIPLGEVLPTKSSLKVWDKNLVFFPRKIKQKLYFFHRIKPAILLTAVASLSDLTPLFWFDFLNQKDAHTLNFQFHLNQPNYVGAGCPPIETELGWIVIFHAAFESQGQITYQIHVALLDIEDPLHILAQLPYPILEPVMDYERFGNVPDVVFPTACLLHQEYLYIYYGAADTCIACASVLLADLKAALVANLYT